MRFQDLFHPPGVLFRLSLTVLCSLSVDDEYLALEDGPPYSDRISRVPPYFSQAQYHTSDFSHTGYHPLWPQLSICFVNSRAITAGSSISLATTFGISVDVFFLELLRCFSSPGSPRMTHVFRSCDTFAGGFPHSEISDQSSFASSPKLIAGYHVLRRLSSPRHPPHALIHLTL